MANSVNTTTRIEFDFQNASMVDFSLGMDRYDTELTDTEIYEAACDLKDCDVLKIAGESVSEITDIRKIDSEVTTYDLEALSE